MTSNTSGCLFKKCFSKIKYGFQVLDTLSGLPSDQSKLAQMLVLNLDITWLLSCPLINTQTYNHSLYIIRVTFIVCLLL
jgi:hypothetical protein